MHHICLFSVTADAIHHGSIYIYHQMKIEFTTENDCAILPQKIKLHKIFHMISAYLQIILFAMLFL